MANQSKEENQKRNVEVRLRDDGILEFKAIGLFDEKMAQEIMKKINEEREIIEKLPGKAKNLADMTQLILSPKTGWSSSLELRKIGADLIKWDKIEKVAILGDPNSSLLKVAASFMLRMAGIEKAKYFINREEAIKWLKK
jgi:hypothetical protein